MKYIIHILILSFGLWSCNEHSTENKAVQNSVDTLQTVSVDKPKQDIFIKDKAKYDPIFINGLSNYNESITLIDNYIVAGNDTTYFPENLKLNQEIIFKANQNGQKFLLNITRTNLTNLDYKFQLISKENSIIDTKSGKAILGSMFFLGSEVDEDSETGDGYGCSEYLDNSNNCWFKIRIGFGLDENGKLRATLDYGCEDIKKQALHLTEFPTLRSE